MVNARLSSAFLLAATLVFSVHAAPSQEFALSRRQNNNTTKQTQTVTPVAGGNVVETCTVTTISDNQGHSRDERSCSELFVPDGQPLPPPPSQEPAPTTPDDAPTPSDTTTETPDDAPPPSNAPSDPTTPGDTADTTDGAAAPTDPPGTTSDDVGSATGTAGGQNSPTGTRGSSEASGSAQADAPSKDLSALPIGLGVFAGIACVALIVTGLVTYERARYRKAYRQRLANSGAEMGYGGMSERQY